MASKKRRLAGTQENSSKKFKKDVPLRSHESLHLWDEEFYNVKASLVLPIPPTFASNPKAGIQEMLDSMVMRYIPMLHGILISHSNASFLVKAARLIADCPYAVCQVTFDAVVWNPQVGMRLVGKVKLCSPDHVALLIHRTFNVSIPRHHIPADQWEFQHEQQEDGVEQGASKSKTDDSRDTGETEGRGRWRNRTTGDILGDSEGYLEFTVIGVTLANEMLSLHGSLQPEPFSPTHESGRTSDAS